MTMAEKARRDAAIVRMAKDGQPPRQIEAATGVTRGVIYNVLTRARQRGKTVPRFDNTGPQVRRA